MRKTAARSVLFLSVCSAFSTSHLKLSESSAQKYPKSVFFHQIAANSPATEDRFDFDVCDGNKLLAAVYDGHGGSLCSQYLKENLVAHIKSNLGSSTFASVAKASFLDIDDSFKSFLRPQFLAKR